MVLNKSVEDHASDQQTQRLRHHHSWAHGQNPVGDLCGDRSGGIRQCGQPHGQQSSEGARTSPDSELHPGCKRRYQLSRPPEETTIASIIAALEGPIALTECSLENTQCEQSHSCHVRGNWSVLNRAIQTALESVTLADMASPMSKAPEGFRIPISSIALQPRRITE